MLNEGDIKAAVINRLFKSEALDDAVLINEMVIAEWSRRADLVVANGKLHVYEIKSDFDSLRRLRGQLATYLLHFDKVTVVSTPRFIREIQDVADPRVEIWCAEEKPNGIFIKIAKRGTSLNVQNKKVLCGFLLKTELLFLLESQGINVNKYVSRRELEVAVESLSLVAVRRHVLSSLKTRYKSTFEAFCKQRSNITKPKDLSHLSKLGLGGRPSAITAPDLGRIVEPRSISRINVRALAEKYGPLPVDMPQFILKRA